MKSAWDRCSEEVAARVDVAFRDALLVRRPRRPRDVASIAAACERFLSTAPFDAWLASPEPFFGPPAVRDLRRQRGRGDHRREVVDVRFRSDHELIFDEVRESLAGYPANRDAHARLFLHRERERPAVMLVHGYFGGTPAIEERFWAARELFERGLHVALYVLPFHGARRGSGPLLAPPAWPHRDHRRTFEGFRQAIHELRGLRALLADEGASAVGAMGMSLGGYTTALLATAEPELAFVAPLIPLASFADFYLANGQLPGTPAEQRMLHGLIERLNAPISPLARPVLVPEGSRMVLAGARDHITPLRHAERLGAHFGVAPTVFRGGHLMQLGRRAAIDQVIAMLERQRLLD